ncbi:MAG: nodulation S family protein [Candidatus Acetothermia bacterium]|jgi:SAM-dependent methyltransferase|nr:nodulation S family protein [Candidatus Acetothermia bacterium]MDH7504978.1 SAM-dependent methyltransferase [Candidatus Acetothermia bacterium]
MPRSRILAAGLAHLAQGLYGLACALVGRRLYSRGYFERLYRRGSDPWNYSTSDYEQRKYRLVLEILPRASYSRVLELGSSEGVFTAMLGPLGTEVLGIDISHLACERARARCAPFPNIRFRAADIREAELEGRFDLILCSEVLYYLGGRRVLAGVRDKLADLLADGGQLVLVNPLPLAWWVHKVFRANRELQLLHEHLERDLRRPYAITLWTKVPEQVTSAASTPAATAP